MFQQPHDAWTVAAAEPPRTTLYINGRFLAQQPSGTQRFARSLGMALDDRSRVGHASADIVLLTPQDAPHRSE